MDPAHPAPHPQPLGYEQSKQPLDLPFPDQRGGLRMMGVVLMVLGGMSGCLTALTPAMLMMPKAVGAQPSLAAQPGMRDVLSAVVLYAVVAAALICVGAGSFRIRRWSRPIAMVLLGTWAAAGASGFISWILFAPSINKLVQASATTGPAPATMPALPGSFSIISGGCMLVFFVALPIALFWFYKRPSVRQTLDYFDPTPTWTDRCPIPVLAISFWLGMGALALAGYCGWGVLPAFGRLLHGPPAITAILACAVVLLALAVATYRVKTFAWWATMALVIVGMSSSIMTFSRVDPLEMYRLSGTPQAQIDLLHQAGVAKPINLIIQQGIYGTAMIVYLLWARRFFTRRPGPI